MKKIIKAWKKGWCIIARLWLFFFLFAIITFPFHFFQIQLPSEMFDENGFHIEVLFFILFALAVIPLIFYLVSRLSGEFVEPKKRKSNRSF